ncbi:hypothetical protein ACFQX6_03435 [Streptosporangium lutulentum]
MRPRHRGARRPRKARRATAGGAAAGLRTVRQPDAAPAVRTGGALRRGNDEYRCFLVDPKLSDRAFLTGSQFLPQNTDLVHHAIVFRVGPDKVEAARALDARTPGEGWTCFGDAASTTATGSATGHREPTRRCSPRRSAIRCRPAAS